MKVIEHYDAYGFMNDIELIERERPRSKRKVWVILWQHGAYLVKCSSEYTDKDKAIVRFQRECRKDEKNHRSKYPLSI